MWFRRALSQPPRRFLPLIVTAVSLCAMSFCRLPLGVARGADENQFTGKVLPIFRKHCADCHSSEAPESELDLTAEAAVLRGARSGHIVAPGKGRASLISQLLAAGSKPHMPPEGQLSAEEIATIQTWIDGLPADALPERPRIAAGKNHWAFRPVVRPSIPEIKPEDNAADAVARTIRTPVDRFIVAKLQAAKLKSSGEASRERLLRRAYFDLIGLPPTPEDVQRFVNDTAPDAYEQALDRLLASPAYGERWGRHWLDLARYADSGGFHEDIDRPHAWKYRDYVIRSLNQDKPYGQFVREQLAGDELPEVTAESLAATAFCRNGPTNDDNMGNNAADREKYRLDLLDDTISTTSAVYLGLTIGCARCHDHKFDPLPQSDYYQLLAVFNNLTRKDVALNDQGLPLLADKGAEKGKPAVMAIVDVSNTPRETFILWRGDLLNKGPQVKPGVPGILASATVPFQPQSRERTSGQRLALAEWIALPDNPVTWRVLANRLWQHHFGRGIVATSSNFGLTGTPPTHPELLDYLASEMATGSLPGVPGGGEWKKLHRLLMTSGTYRQDSQAAGYGVELDPQNLLLWRMNKRRLEAEAIRDSVLSIAGTLNSKQGGPGIKPRIPAELLSASQRNKWPIVKEDGPEQWRRSVYIYVKRQMPFPLLELFDVPSTAHTCDRRQDSTIPTQALVLMNDDFTEQQAQQFAQRVRGVGDRSVGDRPIEDQLRDALRLALSREPTDTRVTEALEFVVTQKSHYQTTGKNADEALRSAVVDLCHVLLNCNELLYVD